MLLARAGDLGVAPNALVSFEPSPGGASGGALLLSFACKDEAATARAISILAEGGFRAKIGVPPTGRAEVSSTAESA